MSYYDFSGYAQDNSQKPDKDKTDVVPVDATIRPMACGNCGYRDTPKRIGDDWCCRNCHDEFTL